VTVVAAHRVFAHRLDPHRRGAAAPGGLGRPGLAETSLVRMSRTKAMALVDDGRRGAGSLMRLVQDPEGFLTRSCSSCW